MAIRQVHGAAAELDALRVARERGNEDQARGDGLGEVGDVLADERLLVAQQLGKEHRLAVLGQRLAPIASDRMQRHREVAELQGFTARVRERSAWAGSAESRGTG